MSYPDHILGDITSVDGIMHLEDMKTFFENESEKTFIANGCEVTVFNTFHNQNRWVIRIGSNIYAGYYTASDALDAVGTFI
jgi:hypothetical protein